MQRCLAYDAAVVLAAGSAGSDHAADRASRNCFALPRARLAWYANLPKARLPGKGAPQPAVGEGGCPFEPGQVRGLLALRA